MPDSTPPLALDADRLAHLSSVLPLPDSIPPLRRTKSCPADGRARNSEEDSEEENFPAVGEDRPKTVGGDGKRNPDAWKMMFKIWKAAVATGFYCTRGPELRLDRLHYVRAGDGWTEGWTGFFMIYWHPAPGSVFRDLGNVHSTLIRFRPRRVLGEELISWEDLSTIYYNEFCEGVEGVFHSLTNLQRDGFRYHIPLGLPPTTGSFAFGLTQKLEQIVWLVKNMLHNWLLLRFSDNIYVLYDRPVHISWI